MGVGIIHDDLSNVSTCQTTCISSPTQLVFSAFFSFGSYRDSDWELRERNWSISMFWDGMLSGEDGSWRPWCRPLRKRSPRGEADSCRKEPTEDTCSMETSPRLAASDDCSGTGRWSNFAIRVILASLRFSLFLWRHCRAATHLMWSSNWNLAERAGRLLWPPWLWTVMNSAQLLAGSVDTSTS